MFVPEQHKSAAEIRRISARRVKELMIQILDRPSSRWADPILPLIKVELFSRTVPFLCSLSLCDWVEAGRM